jgi:serine kinase of HPr protein (carbohydrate metabolism regulator)
MSLAASGLERVHGTALALGEAAVILRGPSGSGKSDLALRAIVMPPFALRQNRFDLVADDQVELTRTASGIELRPPAAIAGKIEVRGLGIFDMPYRAPALLRLVVDLAPSSEVERFPLDERTSMFLGLAIPVVCLAPFEASATVKLFLALERAAAGTLTPR